MDLFPRPEKTRRYHLQKGQPRRFRYFIAEVDLYRNSLLHMEAIDQHNSCFIESIPTNDVVKSDSSYSKIITWLIKDIFLEAKVEYYDPSGCNRLAHGMTHGMTPEVSWLNHFVRLGAEFLMLCTNMMHKMAYAIESGVDIQLLHIADPTAEEIIRFGMKRVGLLKARFTMEPFFYRGRLRGRHNLEVIVQHARAQDCRMGAFRYHAQPGTSVRWNVEHSH